MPRNPIGGVVLMVAGLAWATAGVVLAAWAATTARDPARGLELASWGAGKVPFGLPWDAPTIAAWAVDHLLPLSVAAAVFLAIAAINLRAGRIALRPASQSHDGKGELQLAAGEPRVGRALEGSIRLRDAPAPGDEFDVALIGGKPGSIGAQRIDQRVRARQGAHGVYVPFRLEVPAAATPSGLNYHWRLEFAPTGRRAPGRSWFDVKLGPPPAHARTEAAFVPAASSAPSGYAEHIEKLTGALGIRMTEAQRERLRTRLAEAPAASTAQLDALRKLTPQHVKLLKYLFIGFIALFFVLPFVFSVLGLVLAAIFGS